MKTIVEKLFVISDNIDQNIESYISDNKEYAAQNIVKACRDLVEKTAILIQRGVNATETDNKEKRIDVTRGAVKALKDSRSKFRWLWRIHERVQGVVAHDLPDTQEARRLLVKWQIDLLKIKKVIKSEYGLDILSKLELLQSLPIDKDVYKYYEVIGKCIEAISNEEMEAVYSKKRYYVYSSTIFQIGKNYFYQIQYAPAIDRVSNTERFIAFSSFNIQTRYAVRLSTVSSKVNALKNIWMPITVITDFEIAIRPAEWTNFAKVVGRDIANVGRTEQRLLMNYMRENDCSLLDIVENGDRDYEQISKAVRTINRGSGQSTTEEPETFRVLDAYREIIQAKQPGSRVLRYLLLTMRNGIITSQLAEAKCHILSDLYLQYGCNPFDSMPFCSQLKDHNPKVTDLYACIEDVGRKHEHVVREVRGYYENGHGLYMPKEELLGSMKQDENVVKDLIAKFHYSLYVKHKPRREIRERSNHYYIFDEEETLMQVLTKLNEIAYSGVKGYKELASDFMNGEGKSVDCKEKKVFLEQALTGSKVAAIYGPAGTGKTFLAGLLVKIFKDKKIHFIAHTHAAVNNLMQRVGPTEAHHSFSTISKYVSTTISTEILFIDECSMVTNKQMAQILQNHSAKFDVLIIMGDVLQLESIGFGNWFKILKQSTKILPQNSRCNLTKTYRTDDDNLSELWNKVRQLENKDGQQNENDLSEYLATYNYTDELNESFFDNEFASDTIVLCLNYGGLYGINNINGYLQECNEHEPVAWYDQTYKVGDPILFNSNASFMLHPKIYNNCKGQITDVCISRSMEHDGEICIEFVVSLDDIEFTMG